MSLYRTVSNCILAGGFGVALACGPAFVADAQDSTAKPAQPTVVFVCKYGSVNSVVAAERFNRLAKQRGLAVRAIGRAANPGTLHTEVPEVVIRELALEGANVATYKPKVLAPEEAAAALRVVHITVHGQPDPNSSVAAAAAHVPEERWDDVPSMVTGADGNIDESGRQFTKARTPLVLHVDELLDEVAKTAGGIAAK